MKLKKVMFSPLCMCLFLLWITQSYEGLFYEMITTWTSLRKKAAVYQVPTFLTPFPILQMKYLQNIRM